MKTITENTKEIKGKVKSLDSKATPVFENVKPMLSTPLEITRDKLRMMNMVDENIIIHDSDIKQDCE
ncbi:hypothetical protein [Chryseobacterium oryctis]|uniref:Uncharacterized protein n=1 Tax=Chryseobacterium oryctis TaxID=2952618 RepID=A0ABT3HQ88_9FLAO|nr:hypothetical protein [Chryseobacterium oryctis]MCW3161788.1 hypothetical protein [Chryseobacterium oryctis]